MSINQRLLLFCATARQSVYCAANCFFLPVQIVVEIVKFDRSEKKAMTQNRIFNEGRNAKKYKASIVSTESKV